MGFIAKHKKKFIAVLRFLNDCPGFKRIFYHIHEIRKNEFKPSGYTAVMIKEGYLLGVNDFTQSPTWRDRMATQTFETTEIEIVKKLLPLVEYFIDIGAHIGYYTCLAAHHGKKVLAFEPIKENYETLLENVKVNRFNDVTTHNVALGESKNKATVYGVDAGSSIVKESFPKETKEGVIVEVDTLDNYIGAIPNGSSAMFKIDTEGGEYNILKGGSNFIKEVKPLFMFIEIVKNWGGGINPNFEKTFSLLEELGYENFINTDGQYFFIRKDMKDEAFKKMIAEIHSQIL